LGQAAGQLFFKRGGSAPAVGGTGDAKNQRDEKPALRGAGAMIKLDKKKAAVVFRMYFHEDL
jgi:hypothetical protein